MAILFVGAEKNDFIPFGTVENITDSTFFDANFSRAAIQPSGTSNGESFVRASLTQASADIWIHFFLHMEVPDFRRNLPLLEIRDESTNTPLFRIDNNETYRPQYWDGGSWVNLKTNEISTATDADYDVHVKIDATAGLFVVYQDAAEVYRFEGDTSSIINSTTMDTVDFKSLSDTSTTFSSSLNQFSQVAIADEKTLGWKIATLGVTAQGTETDWTGDNTNVDEITLDVNDFISSDTAGQIETFAIADLPTAASSLIVKEVGVLVSALRDSTGPSQLELVARTNSTNYFSSTLALSTSFESYFHGWTTNPNTGVEWTQTEVDALELGVRSVT